MNHENMVIDTAVISNLESMKDKFIANKNKTLLQKA
jgi:hypothetical protein